MREYPGALNFHFGVVARPKGSGERNTAEFGTLVNWISLQNVAMWPEF